MRKDLTDLRFGRLIVLSYSHKNNVGRSYWLCKCDCGNQIITRTDVLTRGIGKSCGCLKNELSKKRQTIHGHTSHNNPNGNPTYVSWKGMKQRCHNPNSDQYHRYGALGIRVCDRWLNNFENFLEDMGERPEGMTLDRINPYKDYEPSNCRWADWFEQNNNQRRHYDNLIARR